MIRQPSTIRRIWLTIASCEMPGRIALRLSPMPPRDMTTCMAVLMTRGDVPQGWPLELDVVSDPTADPALRGKPGDPGASAYDLARQDGYGGTRTAWLASLVGAAGASAYDLARAAGYGGTQTQWLATLVGAAGLSAYDVAKAAGFVGTQAQWLASLKGAPASALLGTVTIAQTASLAVISAGIRRIVVAVPASAGLTAGDSITLAPTKAMDGYAVHDAVAVSATSINVGVTAPLLAIGANYSLPCRLIRLNG
nr:hypothetical protein [uncultured organism]